MIRDVIFNQLPKGRESLYFLNLEKKYPNFVPIYGYIIGVIEAAFGNKLPDERVSTEMHKLYTDLIVRKDVQLVKMFDDYDMSSIALENLIKGIRGYSND